MYACQHVCRWRPLPVLVPVSATANSHLHVFFTLQKSMVVPSTPLHTTRVLTEDRAMWEDVKVRTTPAPPLTAQTFTLQHGAAALQVGVAHHEININVINLRKQFSHNAVQGDLLSIHLSTFSVFKCVLSHSKVRWCHSDVIGVYKDPLITQTFCYSAGLWSLFLLLQVPWEWREFRVKYFKFSELSCV